MRVVVQRVKKASVEINGTEKSSINQGLLILLGITHGDNESDIDWLASKIPRLRIFADDEKPMNLSLKDISGELMVVSQFTLFASTKKGNRPSFLKSAPPGVANQLYEKFVKVLGEKTEREIKTGEFGADMQVQLINDGPVTIAIDSKNRE